MSLVWMLRFSAYLGSEFCQTATDFVFKSTVCMLGKSLSTYKKENILVNIYLLQSKLIHYDKIYIIGLKI